MPERLLFVFAKEPRPGHVKTRMSPPLTPEQAARCQRAFLSDLLDRFGSLAAWRTVLCAEPWPDAPELARAAAARGLEAVAQGEGELGARMARVLAGAVARGATAVLVGADSPDLPRSSVEEAFDALCEAPLVLGPSRDGGYYLVGCRGDVPAIFDGVAWGTATVLARTLQRARSAGVPVRLLSPWWDVDDFADLRALVARVRSSGDEAPDLPACLRLFADLVAEGVRL